MIKEVCCWVPRGEAFRTPPGPEGSNGKELPSGAAGKPGSTLSIKAVGFLYGSVIGHETGEEPCDALILAGSSRRPQLA